VTASTLTVAEKKAAQAMRLRPAPPDRVREETPFAPATFVPAPDVATWMNETFIMPDAALRNDDHQHLEFARIGVVWTNIPNRHQERWLVGTAEIPNINGGAWKRGRATCQLVEWFGFEPDFLLTLYAPLLAKVSDRDFCAVIEHELYHCAHSTTAQGVPRFHKDGAPIFGIRGHDVEEFTGVVRRYARRRGLTLTDVSDENALTTSVHATEETLCYVHGNLCSDFVARASDLGFYSEAEPTPWKPFARKASA
jgi:hypothetical protein